MRYKHMPALISLCLLIALTGCTTPAGGPGVSADPIINPAGKTLSTRIGVPAGYRRVTRAADSFGQWLRALDLKPDGTTVKLFNGVEKGWQHVHAAVIDLDVGKSDLQQCADACIRMRAEYLWAAGRFDEIAFNLTNGFRMDFSHWRAGHRLKVSGNRTWWEKTAAPSDAYSTFRSYLDKVFMYAGTLSLEKELPLQPVHLIAPGDLFIWGGSPGHASMVMDVAEHTETGKRIFLLAQGYMPAQDIHILVNPNSAELSPWYNLDTDVPPRTCEWNFPDMKLRRWK
jgi:hypothetical protein